MQNARNRADLLTKNLRRLRLARRNVSRIIAEKYLKPPQDRKLDFFQYPGYLKTDIILSTKWLFNGFIVYLDDLIMLVDPGAELLGRVGKIENLLAVNTLFISHDHIDHYSGANLALEFMSLPSKSKKIDIVATKDVFQKKVISDYHSGIESKQANINRGVLSLKRVIRIGKVQIKPVRLQHTAKETYGFVLQYGNFKLGYISDTGYTQKFKTSTDVVYNAGEDQYKGEFAEIISKLEYIKKAFQEVDVLVANINDLFFTKHSKHHMTGFDLIDILKNSKVKYCIIPNLHPLDLINVDSARLTADYISKVSKIKTTHVPPQGLTVNLKSFINSEV